MKSCIYIHTQTAPMIQCPTPKTIIVLGNMYICTYICLYIDTCFHGYICIFFLYKSVTVYSISIVFITNVTITLYPQP